MIGIKESLVTESVLLFSKKEASDILHLLSQGGYCLEINFEQGLGKGSVPIGFIYGNKFLKTRLELAIHRKSKKVVAKPSRQEIANDLSNISNKLLSLYDSRLFSPIDKVMLSFFKAKYKELTGQESDDSDTWELNFEVDGVWLMGIYCEKYSSGRFGIGIDDVVNEPADILEALPSEKIFFKIPEQSWHLKLHPTTQFHISVGTNLVEKTHLQNENEEVQDYSPLLLPFLKAAEYEIVEHYRQNALSIMNIAEIIVKNLHPPSNGNSDENKTITELWRLREIAAKITEHKIDYHPSGTLPLYYFLKYFALHTNIERLGFNGYLKENKTALLTKMENGLKWIKNLGHNRNKFIHEDIVDSEDEFITHYDGICRVLKLLVLLKDDTAYE